MSEVELLLVSIVVGTVIGVIFLAETALVKSTDILAVTVVLDFILGALCIAMVVGVTLLNDGVFRPYFLMGVGLGIAMIFGVKGGCRKVVQKLKKRTRVKKNHVRTSKKLTTFAEFMRK